ncbi:MAG TPA: sulfite exporter TauE/SafE family protein [Polyangiaceae bacterium]|nr:sulfite exporter TauE/SafE family protein [Polyangiaceae bacterium]
MIWVIALLGMCIGVLAGMLGAGPSILTVLLLTHVAGFNLENAIVTSLAVVAMMSLVALGPYVLERAVDWKPAVSFGLASMTAAFLAGHVARRVPEKVLLVVFLVCMLLAGLVMLVRRPLRELQPARVDARSVAVLAGSGLLIGCITGLISLGGGFAVVPMLVLFARSPVRSAIGASLMVIAINTLAGLAGHLPHPPVDWRIAAYLGGTEAMGSVLGVRLSRRMSATALRHAFACLMLVAAAFMLFHTFLA